MARAAGRLYRGGRTSTLMVARAAATLGLLAFSVGIPAVGQPAPPSPGVNTPSDRDAYLQRVDAEMDGWRAKLQGMTDKPEATGQETATGAESELRLAWDRTEVQARKLRAATSAEWDDAKSSFEQSSLDLSHTWSKSRL